MRRFMLLFSALLALPLSAQDNEPGNFAADRLRLVADGEGIFDVESATVRQRRLSWEAAVYFHYLNDPLMLENDEGRVSPLLEHRVSADIVGAFTVTDWLVVGAAGRVILFQNRPDSLSSGGVTTQLRTLSAGGPGDLRLMAKARLVSQEQAGVAVAVIPSITLPTGGSSDYRGEGALVIHPEVAVSRDFGQVRFSTNLGYLVRVGPRTEFLGVTIDDELVLRLGGAVRMGNGENRTEVGATLTLTVAADAPFADSAQTSVEALAGVRQSVTSRLEVYFAGGAGFAAGVGNPDLRLVTGIRYRR